MTTATAAAKPSVPSGPQKCTYCAGTGRWSKDVLAGKPAESVYCPHCHGSGAGGSDSSSKEE